MDKHEFLKTLRKRISSLPEEDIKRSLEYYSEMIDDFVEDGLSEREAVERLGNIDEIVSQILSQTSFVNIAKKKVKSGRVLRVWEIVLIVLGSPIWLSLLIAAFAVIISLYATLWSVIISLWSVFVSATACAPAGMLAGVIFVMYDNAATGIAMISAGIVCAGLAIFIFYACKAATKGTLLLTKKIALFIKKCFVKKERA